MNTIKTKEEVVNNSNHLHKEINLIEKQIKRLKELHKEGKELHIEWCNLEFNNLHFFHFFKYTNYFFYCTSFKLSSYYNYIKKQYKLGKE